MRYLHNMCIIIDRKLMELPIKHNKMDLLLNQFVFDFVEINHMLIGPRRLELQWPEP